MRLDPANQELPPKLQWEVVSLKVSQVQRVKLELREIDGSLCSLGNSDTRSQARVQSESKSAELFRS